MFYLPIKIIQKNQHFDGQKQLLQKIILESNQEPFFFIGKLHKVILNQLPSIQLSLTSNQSNKHRGH